MMEEVFRESITREGLSALLASGTTLKRKREGERGSRRESSQERLIGGKG